MESLLEMRTDDEFGWVDKWPVILDPGYPPIIKDGVWSAPPRTHWANLIQMWTTGPRRMGSHVVETNRPESRCGLEAFGRQRRHMRQISQAMLERCRQKGDGKVY